MCSGDIKDITGRPGAERPIESYSLADGSTVGIFQAGGRSYSGRYDVWKGKDKVGEKIGEIRPNYKNKTNRTGYTGYVDAYKTGKGGKELLGTYPDRTSASRAISSGFGLR